MLGIDFSNLLSFDNLPEFTGPPGIVFLLYWNVLSTKGVSSTIWAGNYAIYNCLPSPTGDAEGWRIKRINKIKRSLSMEISISLNLPLHFLLYVYPDTQDFINPFSQ